MTELADKVVLITGATGGIGRAVAMLLASRGAKVLVNGRDDRRGEKTVRDIAARGGIAAFARGDVLKREDMDAVVTFGLERFGQIDVLVASAGANAVHHEEGLHPSLQLFHESDPEAAARMAARSNLSKLIPARAVVKHMIEWQNGSIVFITSEGGRVPTPGQTSVALASGGLIMATKVMAKELSRWKIRVNTVAITLVKDTPSWDRYVQQAEGIESRNFDRIRQRAPFGLAKPAQIAGVVSFLASDDAAFVTGATISATGGVTYS